MPQTHRLLSGAGVMMATFVLLAAAATVTHSVPCSVPTQASALGKTPIGVSFEFFMWPSYMTNITLALPCLDHISKIYQETLPVRIGGTTQDRATFDPGFDGYVSYTTPDPLIAPMQLTYGPKFLELIPELGTETILGFNRGDNNRSNTFAAALAAKGTPGLMQHLWAVELGNEPDVYLYIWNKPVATAPWDAAQEGADAADWAQDFANRWESPLPILAGGVYAAPFDQPAWPNLPTLINQAYNASVKAATKVYCGHLYALSNSTELSGEMNHARTVADLSKFVKYVDLTKAEGRDYILGETGFHATDVESDASFGGALQILDKSLRAVSLGIKRLYYHQGTIDQAFFNWWSSEQVEYPFYGGFMSTLALQDGDHVISSDDGTSPYAQYVIYRNRRPHKVVLINTEYYSGDGVRPSTVFAVTGLRSKSKPRAIRMSAGSSDITATGAKMSAGAGLSIGGQTFSNDNCSILGRRVFESVDVNHGTARVTLAASEAVLIYL